MDICLGFHVRMGIREFRKDSLSLIASVIKKGVVIDKLLDSLIVTKGVKQADLILGDKNAVLVAARILAYGPDYTVEVTNPKTGVKSKVTFKGLQDFFQ